MSVIGLRSTADFTVAGQRPKNWREGILKLYPNGKAPLTALTAAMKERSVDDPEFNWYERELTDRRFALAANVLAGDTTLTFGAGRDVRELHLGNVLRMEQTGEIVRLTAEPVNATQIVVQRAAAGSVVATAITYNANGVNPNALVIGSSFEEGSLPPAGNQLDPVKKFNYTQIFRQTLEFTRTAMKTRLRTGDQVKQAKEDALEMLSMDLERAFLLSELLETTVNGKPMRLMQGIIPKITQDAPQNIITAGATTTMAQLESWLEIVFRVGSSEKMCFCGNTFLLVLQQIIRRNSAMQIMSGIKEYGMNVMRITTAFGDLVLKSHPLFNNNPGGFNGGGTLASQAYMGMTSWGLILDMKELQYVYLKESDIQYQKDLQTNGLDGEKSGYLGECSIETHFAKSHMLIKGLRAPAVDT